MIILHLPTFEHSFDTTLQIGDAKLCSMFGVGNTRYAHACSQEILK